MINVIKDKDLIWEVEKYDVILIGTSIYCALGNGFQFKIKNKYPILQVENDKTPYGDNRKLGKRLTIKNHKPILSLMYVCDRGLHNKSLINYDALENCLRTANAEFNGLKVASTIIGCSRFDGNGDKDKCFRLIEECTPNLNITLYDYEQLTNYD
ncbi:MAG: hypothetical protein K2H20_04715, partial [Bacilli bacterium]|nr:hypothetical protein [Bacilli bacterium]